MSGGSRSTHPGCARSNQENSSGTRLSSRHARSSWAECSHNDSPSRSEDTTMLLTTGGRKASARGGLLGREGRRSLGGLE